VVTREQVGSWLDAYVAAWRSYDEDEIRALFAPDATYAYHPYDEPLQGVDAIVADWLREPDEPGSWEASYAPALIAGDRAIATGLTRYPARGRVFRNLFELEFDAGGRCVRFVEWYMEQRFRRPPPNSEGSTSVTDELVANNEAYAAQFHKGDLPVPPAKKLAVLACMDARLNPCAILGLSDGDAHVIRNAGGVVTDDEIRSLAISQRLLGTEEIILIHHTDCGMLTFTDDEFKRLVQEEVGIKPAWAVEAFGDLDEDLRQSVARIKASPFIPHKDRVRGFVYEVESGRLREVT
jgi:carbonic anhydrase